MRLTWYDAGATAATAVALTAYYAHTQDYGFVSGPRVTSLVLLGAGLGACAVNGSRPGGVPTTGWYGRTASFLGVVAMVAGLAGIALGIEAAVATIAGVTGVLWLVTTVRNAVLPAPVTTPAEPAERPLAGVR